MSEQIGLSILEALNNAGYEAYFVGGCVRDSILSLPVKDWDIATNATPDQVQVVFPDSSYVDAKVAYPVVSVNGFEVASFRSDGVNRLDADGMKLGVSMFEDALRRDFTFNALYRDFEGRTYDPTGLGLSDLSAGIVRFVGVPEERLKEDSLRALRAVRFAVRFGFVIEENSLQALKNLKLNFKEV